MARYKRITKRKSLKEPDEFISFWGRTVVWLTENRDKLLIPSLAFVVAVVLLSGFFYYRQQAGLTESRELAEALRAFPREAGAAPVAPDAPGAPAEALKAFSDKFAGSKSATLADLYSAHLLYRKSDFDGAAKAYRAVIGSTNKDDLSYLLAAKGLAYSLQESGKYGEAIKTLTSLRKEGVSGQAEIIDLAIARNYELDKNMAEALQEYTRFAEKYPISRRLENVNEKIATLKTLTQSK